MNNQSGLDMLQIHEEALASINESVHDFLLGYIGQNYIYLFVEGRGDISFYKSLARSKLGYDWNLKVFAAGNRAKVFSAKAQVEEHGLSLDRFGFIVDRDFHNVLKTDVLDASIYVTDGYSIENSLCNGDMLIDVLEAYYGCTDFPQEKSNLIKAHFCSSMENFAQYISPLTFQMASWLDLKSKVAFSSIDIKDYVSLAENLIIISGIMPDHDLTVISKCVKASRCPPDQVDFVKAAISLQYPIVMITRGKYVAWFFCKYLELLPRLINGICADGKPLPAPSVSIGPKNFASVCGAQSRIPPTLFSYLKSRFPMAIEGQTQAEAA